MVHASSLLRVQSDDHFRNRVAIISWRIRMQELAVVPPDWRREKAVGADRLTVRIRVELRVGARAIQNFLVYKHSTSSRQTRWGGCGKTNSNGCSTGFTGFFCCYLVSKSLSLERGNHCSREFCFVKYGGTSVIFCSSGKVLVAGFTCKSGR